MKELITIEQANHIMLLVLIIAPVIGVLWGAVVKRPVQYLLYGLLIGGGNYVMWTVYSAITNKLGLDTVKNLLVNLALFIVIGIVIGVILGRFTSVKPAEDNTPN